MTGARMAGNRLWLGYLVFGLVVVAGYYLTPTTGSGPIVRVVVYCAISVSAAAAVLYGVFRNRPRPPLPWLMLGLSQVVYAAADTTFYISHYVFQVTAFPSAADPLYLGHYPLVVAGLVLLIRRRAPGRDLPGVVDAAVLSVAAGMLSWLYLIAPRAQLDAPLLTKVASLAYPMMDLAMLVVALRLILGPGRRPASFFLLSANLLAMFTADSIYVLQQLAGTYSAGNFLDAIWLSGNLALGAAALHPTMAQLGEPAPATDSSLGPARIAALCAAALVAPVTLLLESASGEPQGIPVIATACALLFMLTIARLAGLVSDQRRLAITDALTGLHTRRFFEAQLPLEVARACRGGGTLAVFIIDVDHFKSINDGYGHPAGDQVLTEIATRLREAARSGDVLARYGGEEFALLVPDASPDELPVIAERLRSGVSSRPIVAGADTWIAVTVSVGIASCPLHGNTPADLVATADRALYAAKARGRDRIMLGATANGSTGNGTDRTAMGEYLYRVADEVDALLAAQEHSRAIARWAAVLAIELGHDEAVSRRAELGGRLHDIGKIVIPEAVLTKPGQLSPDEWLLIRQHPDHGARLARTVPGFAAVSEVIRQHHERFDGTGYPQRLAGTDIRIEARIVAVCDSWAAMRSDRPYQSALSQEAAREQLRLGSGTQFDPEVADAFLRLEQRGLVGELRCLRPEHTPVAPHADQKT